MLPFALWTLEATFRFSELDPFSSSASVVTAFFSHQNLIWFSFKNPDGDHIEFASVIQDELSASHDPILNTST